MEENKTEAQNINTNQTSDTTQEEPRFNQEPEVTFNQEPEETVNQEPKKKKTNFFKKIKQKISNLKNQRSQRNRYEYQRTPYEPDSVAGTPYSNNNAQQTNHADKPTSKMMSEILMLVALALHLFDVLYLGASIDPGPLGIRAGLYIALIITTIVVLEEYTEVLNAFRKYALVAMWPVIIIPGIGYIIRIFGASKDISDMIAGFVLLAPIYAFYLFSKSNLNYTLFGDTTLQKIILAPFQPSGWFRAYLIIIVFVVSISLITATATTAEAGANALGITDSGFHSKEVIDGAMKVLVTPLTSFKDWIEGVGPKVNSTYWDLYNETIGIEYVAQVEENKENTGVFIRDFSPISTLYESQPIDLVATMQMRSFVDDINMTTRCYAIDPRNQTNKINGTTNPQIIQNLQGDDYRTIGCRFEQGQLTKGNYAVHFEAEFNFETWVYNRLTLMDSEYYASIKSRQEVLSRYSITPVVRPITTSGPIALEMNQNMEMPIRLITQGDSPNYVNIALNINQIPTSGSRGQITKVHSFELRAQNEFQITQNRCIVPGDVQMQTRPGEVQGYTIYSFDMTSVRGMPTKLTCNAIIPPANARQLLADPTGKKETTIVGSVIYDYVLTRNTNIRINP